MLYVAAVAKSGVVFSEACETKERAQAIVNDLKSQSNFYDTNTIEILDANMKKVN